MFTGIIETMGTVTGIEKSGTNLIFEIESLITPELKIDQSVAHDGVCLTITEISDHCYKTTAIEETLSKTNLGQWYIGKRVNLERCLQMNGRIDGHIVQGHVDATAVCRSVEEGDGSHVFTFEYPEQFKKLLINKGSVTINGVSLTVIDPSDHKFSVAIIPYTYEHTNFHQITTGSFINIEFDIIGKYLLRFMEVS